MTTQTEHSEPQPCHTGEPEEDSGPARIELPAGLALYLGLFIAFFTAHLAFLTINDFNDSTKTLPDIVQSLITTNAANSTLAAIGLSVITVQVWRASRFIGGRISHRLAGPFPKGRRK